MRIQPDRLKPILRVEFVLIFCVISALLFTPHARGQATEKDKKQTPPDKTQTPSEFQTTVEIGAQVRHTQGGHSAKFEEVRDVPKGLFIQNLKLDFRSADSPYIFSLRGLEIRERDQRFTLDLWRVGKFRTEIMWDQIPHHFGTGQSFLRETAPGFYQVDPVLRAQLQTLTTPEARILPNSAVSNLIRQRLQNEPLVESKLRRDQALFRQSYQPSDNVELYVQFSWLRNRGTRPMSIGTFVRRAVPAPGFTDIGGAWEGMGQEFLEPIDQRTIDLKVGANFRGERWSAGVEYNLSLFRNRVDSITFENPFRVTDDQGVGAANRYRSVRWQNDLPPNNDSHTISFWARVDLTPDTQARGLVSIAFWTQNDAFLPWTLNTAIVPKVWDALSPVTNPTDVNQLPASSPNAKMRNITQEYALVNRSLKNFRFQGQYRSQSLANQTPTIEFPGYAAFGDSTWRSARTDFYNLPIENLDWDFRHQNVEAGFRWDVLPEFETDGGTSTTSRRRKANLTWRLDYEWEIWNRKFRDVNRNNEHSIRNRLDFEINFSGGGRNLSGGGKTSGATRDVELQPFTTLRLKLDYRYANRRALVYNTQPLSFNTNFPGSPPNGPRTAWEVTNFTQMQLGVPMEFNQLRRFDQADRVRNDGTLSLELMRGERTNFSASYRYLGDEHDKSFYGRLFNRSSFIDAQFTHAFQNGNFFYANYSRETNHYKYRDLAHLLPNPAAPPGAIVQGTLAQYPTANTWERSSRSSLDSFEFGINMAPQQGKWQLDFSYALSFTRDRIDTVNPFPVRADSILHAGANPYPDTVVQRQNLNFAVTRRISENFEIGVRYWYEPYKQDDFSFNLLAPYTHGNLTSETPKYLFQDARYASYHSNVATFFVRYSF